MGMKKPTIIMGVALYSAIGALFGFNFGVRVLVLERTEARVWSFHGDRLCFVFLDTALRATHSALPRLLPLDHDMRSRI